ncbi:hypothetical protein ACTHQY_19310, partial [Rhodococcoides corynebacterioides]|uniref:hypothetical protein n=1 Tax=Rhodococcoides corynebacterioides TaxID=53972 RepID=UPI003F7FA06F
DQNYAPAARALPTGGSAGQVPVKTADGVTWQDAPRAGGGIGEADYTGGSVGVTIASNYGIDASGVPYYDTDGATPGQEAVLTVDATSKSGLSLIKIGG